MADQNFREIQLSGKQLFFLFMASVVVAVGVFLLGVSVGRGVGVNAGAPLTPATDTAQVLPSGEAPGPTVVTPDDTRYYDTLRNNPTPPPEPGPAPTPTAAVPIDDLEAIDEPMAPAPQPVSTPAPAAPPATQKPAPPAPATTKPAPAQASGWSVQVAAFRSRENADRQARQLVAKGYPATVVTGGGLFRVRVGSFSQRAEADRMVTRLRTQEGLTPSVTR